jgi:hypothetical protein
MKESAGMTFNGWADLRPTCGDYCLSCSWFDKKKLHCYGESIMIKLDIVTRGEILLEEFLIPMGLSQNRLAKEIGVPALC